MFSDVRALFWRDPISPFGCEVGESMDYAIGQEKIRISIDCRIDIKGREGLGGAPFGIIKSFHDKLQKEINPESNGDASNIELDKPYSTWMVTGQKFTSHEEARKHSEASTGEGIERIQIVFEFNLGSRAGKEALGKLYHKFSQFREKIEYELDQIAKQGLEGYYAAYKGMAQSYRKEWHPKCGQIMMINCDRLFTGKATVISIGQTGAHMRSIDAYRAGEHVEIDKGGELAFVFKSEEEWGLFKEQLSLQNGKSSSRVEPLLNRYISFVGVNENGYIGTDLDLQQQIKLGKARRSLALAKVADLSKVILMSMDIVRTIVEEVQRHIIFPLKTGGELKTVADVKKQVDFVIKEATRRGGDCSTSTYVDVGIAYRKALEYRKAKAFVEAAEPEAAEPEPAAALFEAAGSAERAGTEAAPAPGR